MSPEAAVQGINARHASPRPKAFSSLPSCLGPGRGAGAISSSEIEAEQGCLIWFFDVRVRGQKGIQEVNIDAGNGNVLGVHHEGPGQ